MLSVNELQENEIGLIANYWHSLGEENLRAMGVDPGKLPERAGFESYLSQQLSTPLAQRQSYCLIWYADGKPVGHCNTNPTLFGDHAYMHLHLWQSENRVKGLGVEFVKLSVPVFFEQLKLKTLYSQPYALNPAANRVLEKAGFKFDKEYTTVPGSINFEQPVKRWAFNNYTITSNQ